jgi:flagellar biosynthesis protein FlhG
LSSTHPDRNALLKLQSSLVERVWEKNEATVATEAAQGADGTPPGASEPPAVPETPFLAASNSVSDTVPGAIVRDLSLKRQPRVWAVAGGKGGVGKSLICANFALTLAKLGHKVLAIDLDLGGSNLHTCLGVEASKSGVGDWFAGRVRDIKDLYVQGPEPLLKLITGSSDPVNILKKVENRSLELIEQLRAQPFDDVVIDLGAGTQESTVEFFIGADEGILSILPEPTSVENAYRFIRTIFLSRLRSADVPQGIKEVIEAAFDQKNFLGIRTPADLLAVVERLDPVALEVLKKKIEGFRPNIVINQVRSQADIDIGLSICSVCRRYFGINARYVGYLEYDNSVWRAVRNKKAVVQEFPNSILTSRFDRMTRTLLGEMKGLFP